MAMMEARNYAAEGFDSGVRSGEARHRQMYDEYKMASDALQNAARMKNDALASPTMSQSEKEAAIAHADQTLSAFMPQYNIDDNGNYYMRGNFIHNAYKSPVYLGKQSAANDINEFNTAYKDTQNAPAFQQAAQNLANTLNIPLPQAMSNLAKSNFRKTLETARAASDGDMTLIKDFRGNDVPATELRRQYSTWMNMTPDNFEASLNRMPSAFESSDKMAAARDAQIKSLQNQSDYLTNTPRGSQDPNTVKALQDAVENAAKQLQNANSTFQNNYVTPLGMNRAYAIPYNGAVNRVN